MICSSVIPRLSSALAKDDEFMSMFVLFSCFFLAILKAWLFFKIGDKPYTKAVKHDILSQFLKDTTIKQQFFKKAWLL